MEEAETLAWVDIETFGLDQYEDPIIEIGICITDLDLQIIDFKVSTMWDSVSDTRFDRMAVEVDAGDESAKYVYDMHTKNGLFDQAIRESRDPMLVEAELATWMQEAVGVRLPITGSSVRLDANFLDAQMPTLKNEFHYRLIDSSTLKELCRRYAPNLYATLPPKTEQHRVYPDLLESIEEFKFYRDNFLKVAI